MTSYNPPEREDSLSLSVYNPSNFRYANSELFNYANLNTNNNFNGENYFRKAVFFLDIVDFSSSIFIFPQITSFNNLFIDGTITQSSPLVNNLTETTITVLTVTDSCVLPFQTFYDQVFNTVNTWYLQNNFNTVNIK
jgi:hypothetical protein